MPSANPERRHRVLVVEDEQIVAMDLELRLGALGFDVVGSVVSAEAAIHAVQALRPDVVLMDIRLGGAMDGVTAAEEIYVCERTPVVIITAYGERTTVERVARSGAYGLVAKPFEISEVTAAIELALSKHGEFAAPAERAPSEVGVVVVDSEGVVRSSNTQAVALLGEARALVGSTPTWVRDAVARARGARPSTGILNDQSSGAALRVRADLLRTPVSSGWLLRVDPV
jgi:DNA-binding NarL/FixJ family response regulator